MLRDLKVTTKGNRACVRLLRGMILMLLGMVMACSSVTEPEPPLTREQALSKWESHGLSAYSLLQRRVCDCPNFGVDFRLRIEANRILSVVNTATETPHQGSAGAFLTAEALFDLAFWLETQRQVNRFSITYDRETGLPSRIFVDPLRGTEGDEYTYISRLIQP